MLWLTLFRLNGSCSKCREEFLSVLPHGPKAQINIWCFLRDGAARSKTHNSSFWKADLNSHKVLNHALKYSQPVLPFSASGTPPAILLNTW